MWILDKIASYDPEIVASSISNGLLILLFISFVFLLQDRLRFGLPKKDTLLRKEPHQLIPEEDSTESKIPFT
jgi:hypothetical protein